MYQLIIDQLPDTLEICLNLHIIYRMYKYIGHELQEQLATDHIL
jgi:hypothetical protein